MRAFTHIYIHACMYIENPDSRHFANPKLLCERRHASGGKCSTKSGVVCGAEVCNTEDVVSVTARYKSRMSPRVCERSHVCQEPRTFV